MTYALFRVIHLVALLILATSLIISNAGFSRRLNREDITNLARVDRIGHVGLLILLLAGLALWLWTGRPAAFYNGNPLFHIKLGLFLVYVGLMAPASLFLARHRKADMDVQLEVPRHIVIALRSQIGVLLIIPVLAYLMARGIGY